MTTSKKNKFQYPNFFYEKNFQKLTIFLLIILIATAMASRKQFILDPYDSYEASDYVHAVTLFGNAAEQIHPLFAEDFYIPPALKLVPSSFLRNNWFHVFSSIVCVALTIGGIFILLRMNGFTTYQSSTTMTSCVFSFG